MTEIKVKENHSNVPFHSSKTYKYHKYADYFPLMDSQKIGELGESMRINGQREDIVLLNDLILDGRNRYLACKHEGIIPRFIKYEDELDPLDFVFIKNFYRRQMTIMQQAKIIVKLLKVQKKKAQERRARTQLIGRTKDNKPKLKYSVSDSESLTEGSDNKVKRGRAIDIVAKRVKASPTSIRKIDFIYKITKLNPFIKKYWKRAQEENLHLEEAYRNIKRALDFHSKKKISKVNLEKVEEVYEASKKDPVIKEQYEKIKNQEISLDKGHEITIKIEKFKESIQEGQKAQFETAVKSYKKRKKALNENTKTESFIADDKNKIHIKIETELNSIIKETISVCPHCKKNIIISEKSSNGQVVKSLLPVNIKI